MVKSESLLCGKIINKRKGRSKDFLFLFSFRFTKKES
jgi:hypothetical protein